MDSKLFLACNCKCFLIHQLKLSFSRVHKASLSKIQGLFKDLSRLSYSFQGLKVMKNPDLSVKMLESITEDISLR